MSIYKVKTPTETRIVKAETKAQAINHVIRFGVSAESLSADDVADLVVDGVKIETATKADAEISIQE